MRDGERPVAPAPWVLPLWLGPALGGEAWLASLADDLRDADARNDLAALGSFARGCDVSRRPWARRRRGFVCGAGSSRRSRRRGRSRRSLRATR